VDGVLHLKSDDLCGLRFLILIVPPRDERVTEIGFGCVISDGQLQRDRKSIRGIVEVRDLAETVAQSA
jgi:hypothetical protein